MSHLLDTNVLSELRRPDRANPKVVQWAAQVRHSLFFISVVSVLEIEEGVLRIERRDGKQGAVLRRWFEHDILVEFGGRILSIDVSIARQCARWHVPNRRPERDALIAATALVHGLTLVTRNEADFRELGVALLNPWTTPSG